MATSLRTIARGSIGGAVNSYIFSMNWIPGTTGGVTADASDCLARFRSFWFGMAGILGSTLAITFDTTVLQFNPGDGELLGALTATPQTSVLGTATGDLLPAQNQGLISWNTAGVVAGRRVIGRTFVPLPTETFNSTGGQPTGSYTSGLAAGISSLLTAGPTASVPAVWARPIPGRSGFTFQITGGTARTFWSVQRGRR